MAVSLITTISEYLHLFSTTFRLQLFAYVAVLALLHFEMIAIYFSRTLISFNDLNVHKRLIKYVHRKIHATPMSWTGT